MHRSNERKEEENDGNHRRHVLGGFTKKVAWERKRRVLPPSVRGRKKNLPSGGWGGSVRQIELKKGGPPAEIQSKAGIWPRRKMTLKAKSSGIPQRERVIYELMTFTRRKNRENKQGSLKRRPRSIKKG